MPIPGVQRFVQPDYSDSAQDGSTYATNIDKAIAVFKRAGDWFAPHQVYAGSPNPDLAVELDPGYIWNGSTLLEVALQQVSAFPIPSAGMNRVDRVVVDAITGVAARVAGTAVTGSPTATAPTIPAGKIPICQVLLSSGDTAILNSMITDERALHGVGGALNATSINFGQTTLSNYTESNWTPSGNGVTLTVNTTATATRIGRFFAISYDVTWPVTADGGQAQVKSVPYTTTYEGAAPIARTDYGSSITGLLTGALVSFRTFAAAAPTNANFSSVTMQGSATGHI